MRPASEIHSALDLLTREAERNPSVAIARDVLAWATGKLSWSDLAAGPNAWLVGYLLDYPPKIEDVDPRAN